MGLIPGLSQWVGDPVLPTGRGLDCRCSLDLALLWLWHRLAATALIRPLAWDLPYAVGVALKSQKKKKEKRKEKKKKTQMVNKPQRNLKGNNVSIIYNLNILVPKLCFLLFKAASVA